MVDIGIGTTKGAIKPLTMKGLIKIRFHQNYFLFKFKPLNRRLKLKLISKIIFSALKISQFCFLISNIEMIRMRLFHPIVRNITVRRKKRYTSLKKSFQI